MRFHHLLGGFVLAFAAAGLGCLIAHPILLQLGRASEAQSAWEIGLLFFAPFALPSAVTLGIIVRGAQVRKLHSAIDRHGAHLLQRYTLHTQPNHSGAIEMHRWSDEVWRFRRALPWKLAMINHRAALRIVTERMSDLAERIAPAPQSVKSAFADQPAFARFVGAELIRLGWRAKLLSGKTHEDVHVLAEKTKVRVVVICRPRGAIGNADVQRAVKARAHTGADLAAIVGNDDFGAAARALARHTQVGLLHITQISGIHRAAGRVWRRRKTKRVRHRRAAAVANAHR